MSGCHHPQGGSASPPGGHSCILRAPNLAFSWATLARVCLSKATPLSPSHMPGSNRENSPPARQSKFQSVQSLAMAESICACMCQCSCPPCHLSMLPKGRMEGLSTTSCGPRAPIVLEHPGTMSCWELSYGQLKLLFKTMDMIADMIESKFKIL